MFNRLFLMKNSISVVIWSSTFIKFKPGNVVGLFKDGLFDRVFMILNVFTAFYLFSCVRCFYCKVM
ncbi:hypothetical protein Hanom_Chr12g01089351 [Helianthus anomalus]